MSRLEAPGTFTRAKSAVRQALKTAVQSVANDELYARVEYRDQQGFWPQMNPPRSWSEHLLAAAVAPVDPLRKRVADKLQAYDYVEETLGRRIAPEVYQVVEDPSEIDFDALPENYVMKPAHASGLVRVVRGNADRESLLADAAAWCKLDFSRVTRERIYEGLRKRVMFEELIDDGEGVTPNDYKFHMFDGKVRWIQLHRGRFDNQHTRMYWPDWTPAPWNLYRYPDKPDEPPPARLQEMLDIAHQLGAAFDFIRVDFYHLPDRVVFGELTNFTGAGFMPLRPLGFDFALGRLFEEPHLTNDELIATAKTIKDWRPAPSHMSDEAWAAYTASPR